VVVLQNQPEIKNRQIFIGLTQIGKKNWFWKTPRKTHFQDWNCRTNAQNEMGGLVDSDWSD